MTSIVTQITSIIKTAHDKIIYGVIERLQMFHLIKFYQEINALEFIKVIEGCFGGDAEPLCKCSYASVNPIIISIVCEAKTSGLWPTCYTVRLF